MREYTFELPYTLSALLMGMAPGVLVRAGVWEDIPTFLRDKIMDAYNNGNSCTFTQEDLDAIDDPTWDRISHLFSQ